MRLAMTFLALLTVDLSIYDNYDRIQEKRERKRHMHPHWPERTPLFPYRISGAECQDAPAAQAGLIRKPEAHAPGLLFSEEPSDYFSGTTLTVTVTLTSG